MLMKNVTNMLPFEDNTISHTDFIAKRTSNLDKLRSLDPEVWPSTFPRIIQTPFQPQASLVPVDNPHGWILYRGVYYYSDDHKYPYVMLSNTKHLSLPIIKCCTKESYDRFLRDFFNGSFINHGVSVHTRSSY